ncbi:O-antigen ligase family protein [Patescibacteria group bacterium]
MNTSKLSKYLFYLTILILPVNLGYHFLISDAYVKGLLLDYLIPTFYLQDFLIILLLALNIKRIRVKGDSSDKFLLWFLFSVFLSTLISDYFISSFTAFLRLSLYALFMLYVKNNINFNREYKRITIILGISILLISILSLFQWVKQSSVFDNYLFFGEQPYSISTPGINIENFFGESKVPPYATFRHPNILGGILSILLVWFLLNIEKNIFLKIAFILGVVVLFFTLAKFAWISFGLGLFVLFVHKKYETNWFKITYFIVMLSLVVGFIFPKFPYINIFSYHPSFYRRADLLIASYKLISKKPLFGVGYNSSTAFIDVHMPSKNDIRFAQPTHNIFILTFVESGIFAFHAFLFFIFLKLKKSKVNIALTISLMQIVFLGSFDHYFMTIHQTQLLMWLILGFI